MPPAPASADAILICVDDKDAAIARLSTWSRREFPLAKVFARAFDRGHAIELVKLGVDYQIREMFESALEFGAETLQGARARTRTKSPRSSLGVRERDRQRFAAQIVGGMMAGRDLLLSNAEDQARESGTVAGPTEPIMRPSQERRGKALDRKRDLPDRPDGPDFMGLPSVAI